MSPEDILNTGQIYSASRIGMMLARHGFSHKRTTGSHIIYTHTTHTDKIVTLVNGAKTTVYQKQAAQACLDILALNQKPEPISEQTQMLPLPEGMEYVTTHGITYVRSTEHPVLGFAYVNGEQFDYECDVLAQNTVNLTDGLEDMRDHFEFVTARYPDGSIFITHPTYALEQTIPAFGDDPQATYPLVVLQHMVDYAQAYDGYLRAPVEEFDGMKDVCRVRKNILSSRMVHYSISPGNQYKNITPVDIYITPNGRMSMDMAIKHINLWSELYTQTLSEWGNLGFEFTQKSDEKMRITHKFMDIEHEMDSTHFISTKLKETIALLATAAQTVIDHEELGEQIVHLWDLNVQTGHAISLLNDKMDSFFKTLYQEFDELNQKLTRHGYARHLYPLRGEEPARLVYTHPNAQYAEISLPFVNRIAIYTPLSDNIQITPYPSMIQKMKTAVADCEKRARPTLKKPAVHALMNNKSMGFTLGTPAPAPFVPKGKKPISFTAK